MICISPYAYNVMLIQLEQAFDIETGGVLLGFCHKDNVFIVEAIEPGKESKLECSKAELDVDYLNYRIKNVCSLYVPVLEIIGVWHKHNHCLEHPFSFEDIIIHKKLLGQKRDIVSILFQKINKNYVMKTYRCNSKGYEQEEFLIKTIEECSLKYK